MVNIIVQSQVTSSRFPGKKFEDPGYLQTDRNAKPGNWKPVTGNHSPLLTRFSNDQFRLQHNGLLIRRFFITG